jgi:mycothiol synthase
MPTLKRFDPDTATHDYFKARHHYLTLRSEEEMPEDPPRSLAFSITNAKNWKLLEKEKLEIWNLWEEDKIIAELSASVGSYGDNEHLIHGGVTVLQPHRRKGYSKLLLTKLVETAETYNRTSLLCNTSSNMPAGGLVAEHLGAKKGMETHTNQLVLAELENALLETWITNAKTSASEFEMGLWRSYPEEEIVAVAKMIEVMNTAPRDNLEVEDSKVDPEVLRQLDAYNKVQGVEFWMLYVRHKPSGELAGYTQTFWNPENAETLHQGDTGVLPKYRGHGLGKWLKAAMIQKVLAERPVVKRIRPRNADSNVPMLAINHALRFKPYIAETVWQIEVQKIKDYLQKKKQNP